MWLHGSRSAVLQGRTLLLLCSPSLWMSLASPWAQEICRRRTRCLVWLQILAIYFPGTCWISAAHPARPRRGRRAGWVSP